MILAVLWGYVVKSWWILHPFEMPPTFWPPLFSVTIFLGVFRTNQAYQEYKEGPKLMASLVHSLTSAIRLASSLSHQGDSVDAGRLDMKRLVVLANTMMAMIRLDVEPPKVGPLKQGTTKVEPGAGSTWISIDDQQGHGSPSLSELLNADEISMYADLTPHNRVMLSSTLLVQEFSSKVTFSPAVNWFASHIEKATAAWRGCCRLRDSTMPMSFGYLYHLMLFVTFIVGTPVAIMCNETVGWWGLGLCAFAPFLTYSLEIMSENMDNPFGWDTNDHDLSKFCFILNEDTKVILSTVSSLFRPNKES